MKGTKLSNKKASDRKRSVQSVSFVWLIMPSVPSRRRKGASAILVLVLLAELWAQLWFPRLLNKDTETQAQHDGSQVS